jgi:acylphosphatase
MLHKFRHISCFIALSFVWVAMSQGEETLQIMGNEQKIVLAGEISKALGTYDEHLQGAVEYLLCGPGGKEYESIIVLNSSAQEIHDAMLKLGVKRGTPPMYDEEKDAMIGATGTRVLVFVEWESNGETKRVRGEDLLHNTQTQKPMQHVAWIFSGSREIPDLDSEDEEAMIPQAFIGNDIIALNYVDGSALFQSPIPSEESPYKKNAEVLPPLGTAVKVTIEVNQKMQRYILISGKVQGVGFRHFTRQNATRLGVRGYAKNLPNGKVEVVAEGDKATLDEFVKILWKGPPASRVEDVKVEARPHSGEYTSFGVKY